MLTTLGPTFLTTGATLVAALSSRLMGVSSMASELVAEKALEERVVEKLIGPILNRHSGIDVNHAGPYLLDHWRHARRCLELAVDGRFLDGQLGSGIRLAGRRCSAAWQGGREGHKN